MRYDELIDIYQLKTVEGSSNTIKTLWKINVPCKFIGFSSNVIMNGTVAGEQIPMKVFINDKIPFTANNVSIRRVKDGRELSPGSLQVLGRKTVMGVML